MTDTEKLDGIYYYLDDGMDTFNTLYDAKKAGYTQEKWVKIAMNYEAKLYMITYKQGEKISEKELYAPAYL